MAFRPFERGCDARVAPPPRSSLRSLLQRVRGGRPASGRRPVRRQVAGLVDVVERAAAGIQRDPGRLVDDGGAERLGAGTRSERSPACSSAWAASRAGPTRTRLGRGRNRSPSCNATASTDASPATRSISSRTAVERSGMSPPATRASSVDAPPARSAAPRAGPPPRARPGRTARCAPSGIGGSGASGATTTTTSRQTSPSRSTGWCRSGMPRWIAASLSLPNRVERPPASTIPVAPAAGPAQTRPSAFFAAGSSPFRDCTNANPKRPLMQRWPLVTELSHGEVTFTISLSCTWSSSSQPTPQYGQIVSVDGLLRLVPRAFLAHVVLGGEHQRAGGTDPDAVAAVDARGLVQRRPRTRWRCARRTLGRRRRSRTCSARRRRTPPRTCSRGCTSSSRGRTARCRSSPVARPIRAIVGSPGRDGGRPTVRPVRPQASCPSPRRTARGRTWYSVIQRWTSGLRELDVDARGEELHHELRANAARGPCRS